MKRPGLWLLAAVVVLALGIADPIIQGVKQAGHQAATVVCR